MDINDKARADIRLQIAEALRWTDAHGMLDVGIHLDRALIAFDVENEQSKSFDGVDGADGAVLNRRPDQARR